MSREQRFWQQGYNDYLKGRQPRWHDGHLHFNPYRRGWNQARHDCHDKQPKAKHLPWWEAAIHKVMKWLKMS